MELENFITEKELHEWIPINWYLPWPRVIVEIKFSDNLIEKAYFNKSKIGKWRSAINKKIFLNRPLYWRFTINANRNRR